MNKEAKTAGLKQIALGKQPTNRTYKKDGKEVPFFKMPYLSLM